MNVEPPAAPAAPSGASAGARVAARRARDDLVLGVDVGSWCIACALAARGPDGPVVLASEAVPSYGIRNGEIVDLARAGDAMRIAVEAVLGRARVRLRRAVLGFSGPARLTVARGTRPFPAGPRVVKAADVAQLRKDLYAGGGSGRRIVHRWDGPYGVGELAGVEDPVGLEGSHLTMVSTFLTAPETALSHLARAARHAGLAAEEFVLAPCAAARGALSSDEQRLGAAVLDFGAGAFRGVLWEGERPRQLRLTNAEPVSTPLALTPAPDGMESVVLAVARHFRLAPSTARRLIREHGRVGAPPSGGLVRAVEAAAVDGLGNVLVELGELSRTIEEFLVPSLRALRDGLSLFADSHAGGVVLTGQGARLPGLPALVAAHFGGAPVRVAAPRWNVEEPLPEDLEGPGGCALCGLLISGLAARPARAPSAVGACWRKLHRCLGRLAAAW